MAKYKRVNIGSIVKSKDPKKSNYLKLNLGKLGGSVTLKDGQYLQVESKKFQLDSLKDAVEAGRMSEETAADIRERVEKIPDFVLSEVILVEEN